MLLLKKNLHLWVRMSLLSILILGSMVVLQACFPFGPEDIEDFDIVGTFYDENVNFSSFEFYAMPDTIVKVDASGVVPNQSDQYDNLILSQIEANMGAIGYTRVSSPEQAEMILTVAIASEGYNIGNPYDYREYYGNQYNYGSGGYYYTGSDYQLSTGTVLMNLANHKDGDESKGSSMWLSM